MIRVTLALLRASGRRLVPAGLSVMLAAAFVAATLLMGNVMTAGVRDQVTARLGSADLVVAPSNATDAAEVLARVQTVPGVRQADPMTNVWVRLDSATAGTEMGLIVSPGDPRLTSLTPGEGRFPDSNDEIALPPWVAQRLDLGVGDTVSVSEPNGQEASRAPRRVTLVGLVEDPRRAWSAEGGVGLASFGALRDWAGFEPPVEGILVVADDPEQTAAALADVLGDDAVVSSRDEVADARVAALSGGTNLLIALVLAFAGLALLVAGLVIANTFQVLISQRTRTLALLRCVGARSRQLRRGVVLEGALVGIVASAVGVLVGIGLAQLTLVVLRMLDVGMPLPLTVPVDAPVMVVPIVAGTVMTVLASLVPARVASRVAPVAALQPPTAPTPTDPAGRLRLVLALLLGAAGAAVLALVVLVSWSSQGAGSTLGLLGLGMLAGSVSFVAVLLGAVFWMPRIVRVFATMATRSGPAGWLAAANAQRNPRRTAATSAALLIGVTLVVTMTTGAATARQTLESAVAAQNPVDLKVYGPVTGTPGTVDDLLRRVAEVPGIRATAPVSTVEAEMAAGPVTVHGIDPATAAEVINDPAAGAALAQGFAVIPADLVDVATVSLVAGGTVTLPAVTGSAVAGSVLIPNDAMADLQPDATVSEVWAGMSDEADPLEVVRAVQEALKSPDFAVSSSAVARASDQAFIDGMLAVTIGLLAVAVLIALIGVANTLSLSVAERRHELATLRSVGLTRGQLRGSLAVEGVLVAVVGAVAGVVLGVAYGWSGSVILLAPEFSLVPAVPWADLIGVVLIAIAAGCLASVLPGRSAARTPPVAALAME